MPNDSILPALLERSAELDARLRTAVNDSPVPNNRREHLALGLAVLANGHARGLRVLTLCENTVAAFALFRPQLEALVRHIWIRHCASEGWLDDFTGPVPAGVQFESKDFPSIKDMVCDLRKHGRSKEAAGVDALLMQLGDAHHSYTHGGMRAIQNALSGCDAQVLVELVKVSNVIMLNTAAQLVVMCSDDTAGMAVHDASEEFGDCMLGQASKTCG